MGLEYGSRMGRTVKTDKQLSQNKARSKLSLHALLHFSLCSHWDKQNPSLWRKKKWAGYCSYLLPQSNTSHLITNLGSGRHFLLEHIGRNLGSSPVFEQMFALGWGRTHISEGCLLLGARELLLSCFFFWAEDEASWEKNPMPVFSGKVLV